VFFHHAPLLSAPRPLLNFRRCALLRVYVELQKLSLSVFETCTRTHALLLAHTHFYTHTHTHTDTRTFTRTHALISRIFQVCLRAAKNFSLISVPLCLSSSSASVVNVDMSSRLRKPYQTPPTTQLFKA